MLPTVSLGILGQSANEPSGLNVLTHFVHCLALQPIKTPSSAAHSKLSKIGIYNLLYFAFQVLYASASHWSTCLFVGINFS